jgi:hypothetical protein
MQWDLSRALSRILLRCVIVGLPLIALAQDPNYRCPPITPDDSKEPQYRRRTDPVRCEGYFTRNVSQKYIEIISLTLGGEARPNETVRKLSLSAPLLPSSRQASLLIQPLGAHPFYRVDLPIATAPIGWNADQMLDLTGLKLARVGFLAVLEVAEPNLLEVTPVSVTEESRSSTEAVAKIRVSVPVTSMRYRVLPMTGSAAGAQWRNVPEPQLFAWELGTVKFNLARGGQRIEVLATDENKRRLPLLRFTVVGSDGG